MWNPAACLRSGSDQRPQAMVALCAVATTRANPGMVAVAVRHSVAHRAGGVTQSHLEPQPQADHNLEERPSHMQSKGRRRRRMQPRPSTGLQQQLEMCSEGLPTRASCG